MGHIGQDGVYERLGRKIDELPIRVPWNETFYAILKDLYSPEEAEVVVRMPHVLSSFDRVMRVTGYDEKRLRKLLDSLCSKGLVMDLWIDGEYRYMPSPFVIGIFEFTMMRTDGAVDQRKCAELFRAYMDNSFIEANFGDGQRTSFMRTLPHETALAESGRLEILDYERASELVESFDTFSIGLCSCRHKKQQVDEKTCDVPLEKCSSFGYAAEFLVRHGMAEKVSKTEMLENLAHSRENGLVLNADNVQKNITYICHCCKCCCSPLNAIRATGYANVVVTSSYIAETDLELCEGCGKCARACPIDAVAMEKTANAKRKLPKTDASVCLGCGVCALACTTGATKLVKRGRRVIHPETTFERIILQSLERGTLQNQIFDNPQSFSQKFMRGFLGGFLRLSPVKRALMSDVLRSSFLGSMKTGVRLQGKAWLTDV